MIEAFLILFLLILFALFFDKWIHQETNYKAEKTKRIIKSLDKMKDVDK